MEERSLPVPGHDEVLLRVRACGVCRTDIHIAEGELPPHRPHVVPGHQIVGEIRACGRDIDLALGSRIGVSWLGGTDGTCEQCRAGRENLCDRPLFTGYDRDGGFADYAVARADFVHPLPSSLDDVQAAPLLCAGIIGFRALRVAGVQPGERVGLYGFGASAHLALQVLQAWRCDVYVATRGSAHRDLAAATGATWTGDALEPPPRKLHRAITFAPAGSVVVAALAALQKGGIVAINAIHLDCMPQFDYDTLLWGERQIRSVTNMTRSDARDFLAFVQAHKLQVRTRVFSLAEANDALVAIKNDELSGAAVIVP
jgi:propanol-preferring alcohol dehydrogenase